MSLKHNIENLITELEQISVDDDQKTIEATRVTQALRNILKYPSFKSEIHLRKYERRLDLWLQNNLEMSKGVITFGQGAIRTMVLINGAAAISILTFLGSLLENNMALASSMSVSLAWFAAGVLAATLVAFGSYVTQYLYFVSTGRVSKLAVSFHWISLIVAVFSIACFVVGIWVAYRALLGVE